MKNRKGCSYYMGTIYRGTKRPILSPKKLQTREDTEEDDFCPQLLQKSQAIHTRKKNYQLNHVQDISVIPYKQHQEIQIQQRKKRKSQLQIKNAVNLQNLINISSLKANPLNSGQSAFSPKNSVSIKSPKSPKICRAKTEQNQVYFSSHQKDQILESLGVKKVQKPIFNHFPSQILLSPARKLKKLLGKKHFQKPSKKNIETKTSNQIKNHRRLSLPVQRKHFSSVKKKSMDANQRKMFNFDGTLQNHKIEVLPKRPNTAGPQKKNEMIRSYTAIANRCIKLKSKKNSNHDLQIQPWGVHNQNLPNSSLLDISFSSIHDNFSVIL